MDNPISVRLWPNPGTDVLHIETGTTGRVGVQVCDATGRAVLAAWGTGVLKLSSAALSPGVYFIEVTTSEGRQTVKWMKQ
ncbi:MAG TPA: T9SS type A sorting domain-containing protein [Flavobacteriales bacterium]|nr:T9SS type A sorting domain-containing protein [Flavobacteriales bacterium]HRO38737.1 T9SS type A sorting domain-containing protein [Flavobacteriales bacterium]HRP80302.1 T9SS type A sorting domain-containing protein [Flavobacteriales bacterium]HRQ83477.1 T9SS type A sorting domain-containing protein [Flavobacteriales bacterium]